MNLKASHLTFDRLYGDESGIEYAVRYWDRRHKIEIEHYGDSILIDIDQLEWLMDCLRRIREELPKDVLP